MTRFTFLCAIVLGTALAGCSRSDQPETAVVTGVITMDGKPVENVFVVFRPLSGGRSSSGRTDAQGIYALQYNPQTAGAKIDKHSVTLLTSQEPTIGDDGKVIVPAVPEKFSKEFTDGSLEREVKAGKNEFNFEATPKK